MLEVTIKTKGEEKKYPIRIGISYFDDVMIEGESSSCEIFISLNPTCFISIEGKLVGNKYSFMSSLLTPTSKHLISQQEDYLHEKFFSGNEEISITIKEKELEEELAQLKLF